MVMQDLLYVQPTAGETERTRGDGSIYLKIAADGSLEIGGDNYEVENEMTADKRYDEMKAALDKKFERMFELKAELDKENSETQAKWNEYYALNRAYEKALKRIIAVWVMDCSEHMAPRPQPRRVL